MEKDISKIKESITKEVAKTKTILDLNNIKTSYLGKKGSVTKLYEKLKEASAKEKKSLGKDINDVKTFINDLLKTKAQEINNSLLEERLKREAIDVTLPGLTINNGSPNILEALIENLEELFISMGYDVVEGPEIEKDLYNFELLNLPIGHPARDAQDTFYTKGEELLLRSQTSPVQIRTMLANKDKTPIRIICPGKVYRRDDDDATHSHEFTQMEGLLVDKRITMADLKGTFDLITHHLFGNDVKTRFRSSFYPFTEPSVELDISCFNCKQKGCHICKQTGWITIGGAGMVHPNVLRNCGYDPEEMSGFAFGFGVERLAMLKYEIEDVRTFYTNDLRIDVDRRDM